MSIPVMYKIRENPQTSVARRVINLPPAFNRITFRLQHGIRNTIWAKLHDAIDPLIIGD